MFDIPNIREYFLDLDYVLGAISDGPSKSFAYRRLKYLNSKFEMYSLLNEFQELADMKVFTGYVMTVFDCRILILYLDCASSVSMRGRDRTNHIGANLMLTVVISTMCAKSTHMYIIPAA